MIFSKETAKGKWDKNNPSKGHCAVVALFLHYKYSCSIHKVKVGKSWHYFNKKGNIIIDRTKEQFNKKIVYTPPKEVNPNLLYKSIKNRYELFCKNNGL